MFEPPVFDKHVNRHQHCSFTFQFYVFNSVYRRVLCILLKGFNFTCLLFIKFSNLFHEKIMEDILKLLVFIGNNFINVSTLYINTLAPLTKCQIFFFSQSIIVWFMRTNSIYNVGNFKILKRIKQKLKPFKVKTVKEMFWTQNKLYII